MTSTNLIIISVMLIVFIVLKFIYRNAVKKAAYKTKKALQDAYSVKHELVQVDSSAITRVNHKFYNKITDELQKLGFSIISDIEDKTLTSIHPDRRTFARLLCDSSKLIVACIYDVTPDTNSDLFKLLEDKNSLKVFEFESEMTNGYFILTSNGKDAEKLNLPNKLHRQFLDRNLGVPEALKRHHAILEDFTEKYPDHRFIEMANLESILLSQERQQALKNEYRMTIPGNISDDEMRKFKTDKNRNFLEDVLKEIRK